MGRFRVLQGDGENFSKLAATAISEGVVTAERASPPNHPFLTINY
jgi:hypothetical protein